MRITWKSALEEHQQGYVGMTMHMAEGFLAVAGGNRIGPRLPSGDPAPIFGPLCAWQVACIAMMVWGWVWEIGGSIVTRGRWQASVLGAGSFTVGAILGAILAT